MVLSIQQAPVSLFGPPLRVSDREFSGGSRPGKRISLGFHDHRVFGFKAVSQGLVHEDGKETHHRQRGQGKAHLKAR